MYKTDDRDLNHSARVLCKKLRMSQTEAEKIFWNHVRGRRFRGLKFYRQCPLFYEIDNHESFYIVDFFCFEKKLAIEIDGKIHNFNRQQDMERSNILNNMGITVIRINNEEIKDDLNCLFKKLSHELDRFT